MNLFKTLTLKWWQTGIFKAGMLALGIAVGTYSICMTFSGATLWSS
jgi:hypothetical protein